jgi:CRISPR-associated protein Cas1
VQFPLLHADTFIVDERAEHDESTCAGDGVSDASQADPKRIKQLAEGTDLGVQGCAPPDGERELLPVRMLNEFAYCPRLYHLMHVEGRWAENVYTIEGKALHKRVDKLDHVLPDADRPPAARAPAPHPAGEGDDQSGSSVPRGADDADEPPAVTRSVPLDSARLGLTAKLDLVSTAPGPDGIDEAVPVETKRGRVPNTPERSYEPERVQLMAQGLLLREHGYRCDHGVLYFCGSRTRVDVPFTPELEARTLALIEQARLAANSRDLPPPLDDSPKCNGCSLSGICLPDETLALQQAPPDTAAPNVRRLYPARDDALPLYVQEQGARVGKKGDVLIISKQKDDLARVRLKDVSQLVLCGNISVTAQTVHLLCEAGVPVVHLSSGHWFYGVTHGINLRNAFDRAAQFHVAAQPERCVQFARDIVAAKGANQRTMVRRNASPPDGVLRDMADLLGQVAGAQRTEQLLGFEGALAACYFRHFGDMFKAADFDANWDFKRRNRRPPRDPVNAMLSFGYALLTKEFTVALLAEGLDPWWGLYHQPRHGRPSLALDLMEPLRPLIVDSAVITAVNTGMVRSADFTRSASGCMLKPTGRKGFLRAYEARLDQLVTHPVFDYRCAWRVMIRLHARMFSRWLRGDIPHYESITTR